MTSDNAALIAEARNCRSFDSGDLLPRLASALEAAERLIPCIRDRALKAEAERAAYERAEEEIRQCGRGLRGSLATHYRAMADRIRALASSGDGKEG